jgi:hypothetical protein
VSWTGAAPPCAGDLGRWRPRQRSGKLHSGCSASSLPFPIRSTSHRPGGQPCRPSAGGVEPGEFPPQRPLQWHGAWDTLLRKIIFRRGRRSTGAFGCRSLSRRRRRQTGGEAAASWPGTMDGDDGGGRGVGVNDARPPPTLSYPLAPGLDRATLAFS